MDLEHVTCRLTRNLGSTDVAVPIENVLPEQYICEYRIHCYASCMCCDFLNCDCTFNCPEGCSCYHTSSWSTNISDCNGTLTNIE